MPEASISGSTITPSCPGKETEKKADLEMCFITSAYIPLARTQSCSLTLLHGRLGIEIKWHALEEKEVGIAEHILLSVTALIY